MRPAIQRAGAGLSMDTHAVVNQATALGDYNAFDSDPVLAAAAAREGAPWVAPQAATFGAAVGSRHVQELAYLANRHVPELLTHDAYGHRVDEVRYHPAYHELMALAFGAGVHSLAWTAPERGGHVARGVLSYLWNQAENGVGCPTGMAYAAIPMLRSSPRLADSWGARLAACGYEPGLRPVATKTCITLGMTLTEKQAGSDLRASTTRARRAGGADDDEYLLTGHKWFCSAPMSDGFFVIAQADAGPTLFLVPRVLEDGSRNRFFIQMLKDKCGNRSNASSSVEFDDSYAIRVSDEGRGIARAMEDAHYTRLDFAIGSAGLMRQAFAQALHYVRGRSAFGRAIAEQPLMQNVLADLAVESEAMLTLTLRIARAFDEAEDHASAAQLRRVGPPLVKYFVCKMAPAFAAEALECMGGNGYIENHPLARLYREAPLNCIWEGSSNMVCLDVLRALDRDEALLDTLLGEMRAARGADARLDAAVDALPDAMGQLDDLPFNARWLCERIVRLWQAALLVQYARPEVADTFVATRLGGARGTHFGAMHGHFPSACILDGALPM
ncbi:MAG: acyl-CoA dehydrogenase family protein [Gammaproteobacteria bacterium]|nr:acyl-CoA dehydrogenase family protein [Gammaproteobacteria bacterium]